MRLSTIRTGNRKSSSLAPKAVLRIEELEARLTPYSLSGSSWLHPGPVSLSFVPDGTNLGGVTSNLFNSFNALWSTTTWQREMLRAAQVWAQQTNLNFTVVADDGSAIGSGAYQQGAGNFGDIRLGGFNGSGSWLGMATLPQPACNYSAGGDWKLNLSQPWRINQTGGFDLFTVAAHEMGHSLGLYHSTVSAAVMYSTYTGVKTSLRPDDTAGIRAAYGGGLGRSPDAFDAAASNGSFLAATNLTTSIDLITQTALVQNLDITTLGDHDYYTFLAPAVPAGALTVKVQSSGLSMLMPTVTVYNALQQSIGSASGAGQYGSTLSVTVPGVLPLEVFYVKVSPAEMTAFGTGKYALTLNFGGSAPAVPLPGTQTLNGSPIQCGGGQANEADHDDDHDGGIGHGFGPARDFNPAAGDLGTAGVMQALVGTAGVRMVTPVSETVRDEQPAPLAVDSLFRAGPSEEAAVTTAAEVEANAADAVFADLFA